MMLLSAFKIAALIQLWDLHGIILVPHLNRVHWGHVHQPWSSEKLWKSSWWFDVMQLDGSGIWNCRFVKYQYHPYRWVRVVWSLGSSHKLVEDALVKKVTPWTLATRPHAVSMKITTFWAGGPSPRRSSSAKCSRKDTLKRASQPIVQFTSLRDLGPML